MQNPKAFGENGVDNLIRILTQAQRYDPENANAFYSNLEMLFKNTNLESKEIYQTNLAYILHFISIVRYGVPCLANDNVYGLAFALLYN